MNQLRIISFINAGLFAVGALLLIIQLWFSIFSIDVFIKVEITITITIILVVSLVFSFIYKEIEATKKIKNGD